MDLEYFLRGGVVERPEVLLKVVGALVLGRRGLALGAVALCDKSDHILDPVKAFAANEAAVGGFRYFQGLKMSER